MLAHLPWLTIYNLKFTVCWLCKPGAGGDDPDDLEWTQGTLQKLRFIWYEGAKVSELERDKKNTQRARKRTFMESKCKRRRMTCWVVLWLLVVFWLIQSGMLFFPLLLFSHVPITASCIIQASSPHRRPNNWQPNEKKKNMSHQVLLVLGVWRQGLFSFFENCLGGPGVLSVNSWHPFRCFSVCYSLSVPTECVWSCVLCSQLEVIKSH